MPLSEIGAQAYPALAKGKQKVELLAVKHADDPLRKDTRSWFDPALAEAGIDDFTWHCLRHSYASAAVTLDVPLAVVSRIIGHSSIQTTMICAHPQPESNKQSQAALQSFYSQKFSPFKPEPTPSPTPALFPQVKTGHTLSGYALFYRYKLFI